MKRIPKYVMIKCRAKDGWESWEKVILVKDHGDFIDYVENEYTNNLSYKSGDSYRTNQHGGEWKEIKKETRVKSAVEIVKWLVTEGYYVDSEGHWYGQYVRKHFYSNMFYYCGKNPSNIHWWHPEWLEEIEV